MSWSRKINIQVVISNGKQRLEQRFGVRQRVVERIVIGLVCLENFISPVIQHTVVPVSMTKILIRQISVSTMDVNHHRRHVITMLMINKAIFKITIICDKQSWLMWLFFFYAWVFDKSLILRHFFMLNILFLMFWCKMYYIQTVFVISIPYLWNIN